MLGTVHRPMRIVTLMTIALNALNALLLFSIAALSIWLWWIGADHHRRHRLHRRPRPAPAGHGALDHLGDRERCSRISASSRTASRRSPATARIVDAPDARPLTVPRGEIVSSRCRFNYGKDRARRPRHRRWSVAHRQAGREGRPRRPLGRRQVDARQPALALLRSRRRPHPDRWPGHRQGRRRKACAARSAW